MVHHITFLWLADIKFAFAKALWKIFKYHHFLAALKSGCYLTFILNSIKVVI